jgi:DNA repair protein RecN (Recombination protein N)
MLTELYIRNFAIIDELRLQFVNGFNVLTGETGAGKSIILDAMMLVLGERADTTVVRAGSETAYVEAMFELTPGLQASLTPLLQAEGLLEEEDDHGLIILARELRTNGRNICRLNGRTVTLSLLREVAAPLIDIHGQGTHLSLLRPRAHLPLLDAYAGLTGEQRALAQEVTQLHKIQRELADLRRDERTLNQRADMLQFQIEEIEAARLDVDEEEELRTERERLANAETLTQSATTSVALLTGLDDEGEAVIDQLGAVERALTQLARFDESQNERLERLQGLSFQISELAGEIQHYLDDLEFNPQRLDAVEERLELINRLKRKYGESIAEILAFHEQAVAELDQISHSEERIEALEAEQQKYLQRIGQLAQALSAKRQAAAQKLATAVESQLADLNMVGARFSVDFATEPDENGAYVAGERGEERLAFDHNGIDRAEFLMSANPGEPLKPMAKVASGGETSRLMLALKTALAEVDRTPTLIFDEIDQGIGGRVGDIVGRKLWGLAAVSAHQVIVVTHLPQLAGYGDRHYHVSKRVNNGRTTTSVMELDWNGRVAELAAMLGTQNEHARAGAAALLTQADTVKKSAQSER